MREVQFTYTDYKNGYGAYAEIYDDGTIGLGMNLPLESGIWWIGKYDAFHPNIIGLRDNYFHLYNQLMMHYATYTYEQVSREYVDEKVQEACGRTAMQELRYYVTANKFNIKKFDRKLYTLLLEVFAEVD